MTAKKKLRAKVKKLKGKLEDQRAELERADGKTARWKKKAQQNEATIASLQKRIHKRDKQLSKAERDARLPSAPLPERPPVSDEDLPTSIEVSTDDPAPVPDESWTVVQLRNEARSRGLTGLSRKTKAGLIAALT